MLFSGHFKNEHLLRRPVVDKRVHAAIDVSKDHQNILYFVQKHFIQNNFR